MGSLKTVNNKIKTTAIESSQYSFRQTFVAVAVTCITLLAIATAGFVQRSNKQKNEAYKKAAGEIAQQKGLGRHEMPDGRHIVVLEKGKRCASRKGTKINLESLYQPFFQKDCQDYVLIKLPYKSGLIYVNISPTTIKPAPSALNNKTQPISLNPAP